MPRLDKRIGLEIAKVDRKIRAHGLKADTVTVAEYGETIAPLRKAEMEALRASLEQRVPRSQLDRISQARASSH